jgi:hypothetical protein
MAKVIVAFFMQFRKIGYKISSFEIAQLAKRYTEALPISY